MKFTMHEIATLRQLVAAEIEDTRYLAAQVEDVLHVVVLEDHVKLLMNVLGKLNDEWYK